MNIIERGRAFLQSLQALAGRSAWDWKQCPTCGSRLTIKNGSYTRRPRFFSGGGGMVSTAPDYLRFAQMLANGGELRPLRTSISDPLAGGPRLLSPAAAPNTPSWSPS